MIVSDNPLEQVGRIISCDGPVSQSYLWHGLPSHFPDFLRD